MTDELAEESEHSVPRKNNGYAKNHNLLNGHVGMNSPPPSPPSLNSSLASLKALAANQASSASALTNGNHGGKHLNGLGQYRNSSHKQRDQSPLRNEHQSPSLLSHNITPAHHADGSRGRGRRGRPKMRWLKDNVKRDLQETGLLETDALDRAKWRRETRVADPPPVGRINA